MMAIPFSKINNVLNEWASNNPPIMDFTVENVLYSIGLDQSAYAEVFKYLTRMDGFELIVMKTILCPNNHKGKSFLLNEPIDKEQIYECYCGEEDYEPDNLMIVFNFSDAFKEEALKKKRTHMNMVPNLILV
jgi:hypothetical protein